MMQGIQGGINCMSYTRFTSTRYKTCNEIISVCQPVVHRGDGFGMAVSEVCSVLLGFEGVAVL